MEPFLIRGHGASLAVRFQFAVQMCLRVTRGRLDLRAKVFVQTRIECLIFGNSGDVRPVGAGVSDLQIHYGPDYRFYFQQRGRCWSFHSPVGTRAPKLKILDLRMISHLTSQRM